MHKKNAFYILFRNTLTLNVHCNIKAQKGINRSLKM